MKIIFYTIDCPQCNILEKKMISKGIEFDKISDKEYLEKLGLDLFPVIEFPNGIRYDYPDANNWINNYIPGEDY